MAKRGPKEVTPEHKAAMAAGRVEGKIVRDYLEALRANKPKRGRRRTAESITAQLAAIETKLADADPVTELKLISERMHLESELAGMGAVVDISALEHEFVRIAKSYSQRNNITYPAWREVGVSAATLAAAGITRSGA